MIEVAVKHIEEQTGVKVRLDEHFSGINEHLGRKYFNITTVKPIYMDKTLPELDRLSAYSTIIDECVPGGHKRISIFLK